MTGPSTRARGGHESLPGLVGLLLACALAGGCRAAAPAVRAPAASSGPVAEAYVPRPLGADESGVAIRCGKVLTVDDRDRVLDPGMIVVRDGRIEYVGAPVDLPADFPVLDYPAAWASPGLVELHSHIQTGGFGDINDMVLPVNVELSTRPTIVPSNPLVRRACAGGVTTLFGIPGSGTSISGFGVLYKTKTDAGYEDAVLRDPGGMKSAYNYNPQRGGGDLGSSWCGLYRIVADVNARAKAALDQGRHDDPRLENIQRVHSGELPVLIHCASAEGVAGVVRMWKLDFDTHCVVSHGSWDGSWAAGFAAEHGVPVNHGPRTINFTSARREDKIVGGAERYVAAGVPDFSLNTDAPIVPQEELFLQASMSARYGADSYTMLRAVTANPAHSFLIGDRVGSLAHGKDADIVITTGDPIDPRSRVELVLIDGEVQYSRAEDGQWF